MKKNPPVTLKAIQELLDEKFSTNNQILLSAFDRDIKFLEGRINNLEGKVDKGFTEVNNRFDRVEDRIQSLNERLIIQSERVRKLERPVFASA